MARPPGTFILPVLHAASFFRDQTLQFTGVKDWEKAVRIQKEGPTIVHPPIETWQWAPSLRDVLDYFDRMARDPGPWSFDFEATLKRDVVCLGIWSCHAPTTHMGICIPFLSQGGVRYWSHSDESVVRDRVRSFFVDPMCLKVGQNTVGYDTGYPPFNARSLIKTAWDIDVQGIVGDTMVAHHLCFSELKHGLAFQASLATDLSPYKDELWTTDQTEEDDEPDDFSRIMDLPDERVRKYNLKDAFAQAVCWNGLEAEMA